MTSLTVISCKRLAAVRQIVVRKSVQEIRFVIVQVGRQGAGQLQLERVFGDDRGGVLLDHAEQDHGHDFVERLFHQDARFDRRQATLNAMAFDLDLGRQVGKLAFL